ncbi:MAG: hypothetical protein GXO32_08000 [Crenarchaeota archaeon]|nr:hypothetical protein [Thermoproteota archaeon]
MASAEDELRKLAADRRRGSWELLKSVIDVLSAACKSGEYLDADRVSKLVAAINPAMQALQALASAISRSRDVCSTIDRWRSYMTTARRKLVENATHFLKPSIVTTISRSSAVLDYLLRAKPAKVILLESRPGEESIDVARSLSSHGIDVEVVPDSCMARAVERSEAVVIGADAITIHGEILNKVGSRPLAMVARCLSRPFIVLAESLKISKSSCRELEKLVRWRVATAWGETSVEVFECVEPKYISYIVTEASVIKPFKEMIELVANELAERLG